MIAIFLVFGIVGQIAMSKQTIDSSPIDAWNVYVHAQLKIVKEKDDEKFKS